jgi:hypothetical protein
MTSDQAQLKFLLSATFLVFGIAVAGLIVERIIRIYGPWSATFSTARAGSNFSKKVWHVIRAGDEILIPTGMGKYPLSIPSAARAKWEATIESWARLGARVIILVTCPNDSATSYWQQFVDRLPSQLKVCIVDRNQASPEDAADIASLDTFHPLLVIRNGQPVAMWIENYHPPESRIAYNVEYVATKDIIDEQRERFDRYLRVLRRLTNTEPHPPHLVCLEASQAKRLAA